ncbi:porin family protein [Flavobacterium psychrotrophum]|uniref:porin family protein n=1 Tax=Flavobacterium psychrotrophum TaxID=2294119 RepID=UPI000E3189C7|nr:porin family protein [Flavobacterium psychrotrophum]
MKKLLLTTLFAGLCSITAGAQAKGNIEFGLNVGYNSSSISTTEYRNYFDSHSSFNVGMGADFFFNDRWSIKVKAIYDRKGYDNVYFTDSGTMVTFNANLKLDYITVPVMANWHFGRKRNWYLNFGPYVGFLVNAKETRFDQDLKEGFNSTDAGLAFGIGVKIPLNDKLKIFFEYDGQSGFSDIAKNNYYSNSYINRGAVNVGLNFLLK